MDEAAIRDTDKAFSAAATSKDIEGALAFYAKDAVVMPPNEPMAMSPEAIRKSFTAFMSAPGLSMSWEPTKAGVGHSGDLGYTLGTYQLSMTGPDGRPISDSGKYLTIWRKQGDGTWKVEADMFNTDTALPALGR
jgi:ketosteroid isomerase-like protein